MEGLAGLTHLKHGRLWVREHVHYLPIQQTYSHCNLFRLQSYNTVALHKWQMMRTWIIIWEERESEPAFLDFASQKHDWFFIVMYFLIQCHQLYISLCLPFLQLVDFRGEIWQRFSFFLTKSTVGMSILSRVRRRCARGCSRIALRYYS